MPPNGEFLAGLIVGPVLVGAICGLLPWAIANARKRTELAKVALISCIAGGFVFGLVVAAIPSLNNPGMFAPGNFALGLLLGGVALVGPAAQWLWSSQ